jgi:hypothetical protein
LHHQQVLRDFFSSFGLVESKLCNRLSNSKASKLTFLFKALNQTNGSDNKKQRDVSWALWGNSADVEGDVGTLVDSIGTDVDYDENPDHNILCSVSRVPASSTNIDANHATVHGMHPVNDSDRQ